jgi:hypothetical protein
MDNGLSFMVGVLAMFLMLILILVNVDDDYKSKEEDLKTMSDLCLKLESKPISYDTSEVTCSNNVVVTYGSIYRESK